MSVIFYRAEGSPFAWRAHLAVLHKQVPCEVRVISFSARDHRSDSYLAINPRGKVPALQDGEFTLYESTAVVEYLEERFPGLDPIFPRVIQERARCRRLVCEVDHYVWPSLRRIVGQVFFRKPDEWDREEIAAGASDLGTELGRFAQNLQGDYLCGATPTAADFALYPMVATFERAEQKGADTMLDLPPILEDWKARIEALPYHAETVPSHWK